MADLTNRMTYLTMFNYFNDIHFINVNRVQKYAGSLPPFKLNDRTSLELLTGGSLRFIVNSHEHIIYAPTLFWNVPGKTYEYQSIPEAPRDHIWADFAGPRARRIAQALNHISGKGFMTIKNSTEFEAVFENMLRIYKKNDTTETFKLAAELEKLMELIYTEMRSGELDLNRLPQWRALSEEIANHPFRKWNFREQAALLNMSYTNFRRYFRSTINCAPHDYLLYCRARLIAREIQTHQISIKRIAYKYGYNDPSALSRLLKRKLGIAPTHLQINPIATAKKERARRRAALRLRTVRTGQR